MHLRLSARFTPMNLDGTLDVDKAVWGTSTDNKLSPRVKIIFTRSASIPTLPNLGKTEKLSQLFNQYIVINTTSLESDLSQTTIPYFDAQEVVLDPPTPITGIGLVYKSTEKSGGFIAPIVQPLDLSILYKNDDE